MPRSTRFGPVSAPLVSFWFHFDWRLPSGALAPFYVVDVAELADNGRIATLHIVYDTVEVRPTFEAETGTSWRSSASEPDQGPGKGS